MRLRILVVDDDPNVLGAVDRMLSGIADDDLASGVAEAIARVDASPSDVVLSDDKMPDASGLGSPRVAPPGEVAVDLRPLYTRRSPMTACSIVPESGLG